MITPGRREKLHAPLLPFAIGVFLTPFARISIVAGYGVSLGDVVLAMGGLYFLVTMRHRRVESTFRSFGLAVPGTFVVLGTLLSGLANQSSALSDVIKLAVQYGFVLLFLPLVLAQLNGTQLASLIKAFVYGMAASILVGLLIRTSLPTVYSLLLQHGYMVAMGDGRQGLFSGVGELAKVPALCLPLVYWLCTRGEIAIRTGAAIFAIFTLGVVVARSGAGLLVALTSLVTLAAFHVSVGKRVRSHTMKGVGPKALITLISGVLGGALLLSRFDQHGADYLANFSSRVVTPLTTRGVESVGSGEQRIQLAYEAWRMIGERPWFGSGPGLYRGYTASGEDVHAVPLMMWAETGILAMLAWLSLLIVTAIAIVSARRATPATYVAGTAVIAAFVVMNFSVPYLYGRDLFFPLLFAFYLTSSRGAQSEEEAEPVRGVARKELARHGCTTMKQRA